MVFNIIHFDEIDSTNTVAKSLAAQGASEGTVLVAKRQTGGRGRLERSFFCPDGGLWFSLILRPSFSPQQAPKCTLLAAIAVTKSIKNIGIEAAIKWPNDIYIGGKKATGILTEMSAKADKIEYIIIGVGINVNIDENTFPQDLKATATSLSAHIGATININSLLKSILAEIAATYDIACREGFGTILNMWRKYSMTLGQQVQVVGIGTNESFTGCAIDIDDEGALLVQKPNGEQKRVLAGDVSIRSPK